MVWSTNRCWIILLSISTRSHPLWCAALLHLTCCGVRRASLPMPAARLSSAGRARERARRSETIPASASRPFALARQLATRRLRTTSWRVSGSGVATTQSCLRSMARHLAPEYDEDFVLPHPDVDIFPNAHRFPARVRKADEYVIPTCAFCFGLDLYATPFMLQLGLIYPRSHATIMRRQAPRVPLALPCACYVLHLACARLNQVSRGQ